MYDAYGARTLFRGCAVLSGCGIILLAMGRLTYRFICLPRDTETNKHGISENVDDDERKPLLEKNVSDSNHTVQS